MIEFIKNISYTLFLNTRMLLGQEKIKKWELKNLNKLNNRGFILPHNVLRLSKLLEELGEENGDYTALIGKRVMVDEIAALGIACKTGIKKATIIGFKFIPTFLGKYGILVILDFNDFNPMVKEVFPGSIKSLYKEEDEIPKVNSKKELFVEEIKKDVVTYCKKYCILNDDIVSCKNCILGKYFKIKE